MSSTVEVRAISEYRVLVAIKYDEVVKAQVVLSYDDAFTMFERLEEILAEYAQ